jgi:hypothetical protein
MARMFTACCILKLGQHASKVETVDIIASLQTSLKRYLGERIPASFYTYAGPCGQLTDRDARAKSPLIRSSFHVQLRSSYPAIS